MGKIKSQKLRTIFVQFTISFCITTLLIIAFVMGLFIVSLHIGILWPANQAHYQIVEATPVIRDADKLLADMIPPLCNYGLYSKDGDYLAGDFDPADAQYVWNLTKDSDRDSSYLYTVIERDNEVCVLRYVTKASFQSETLRTYFPNAEPPLIFLFFILFIANALILVFHFEKKLTARINILQDATDQIKQQDLDFEIQFSGIEEIDAALSSIEELKTALKESLTKQWEFEQSRKQQIAALAHDIKTPLTIIRGNAELLEETSQSDIQQEFTGYIRGNADQIETYIHQLIQISNLDHKREPSLLPVVTKDFASRLRTQMNALCTTKNITPEFRAASLPDSFPADEALLFRAVLNVLDNAVEHTPSGHKIVFAITGFSDYIEIIVNDGGSGFSSEDLRSATEQFYTGDQSRLDHKHYGMGLYITKSIVKQHSGTLIISNNPAAGGGQVTIRLPL